MANNQVSKFVNSKEKAGIVKVFAMKALFGGEDRSNSKLEHSLLHRFVLEGHFVQRKDKNGNPLSEGDVIKRNFTGNLPVEKLPALISLSERALEDRAFGENDGKVINLLPGEWKPMMRDLDEQGNPRIYCLEVIYSSNLGLPIQVKLSNAHAPVQTAPSGKTTISLSKTYDKEELVMYLSVEEWYNALVNCRDNWMLYRNRIASQGYYDEEFLLNKN